MKIIASERKEQGTSASRRLRRAGQVPGIVYGDGAAVSIALEHNPLWHAMRKEGFVSSILEMDINGKLTKVVIRDVQYHPYKPFITHVDFQRVNMKHVMTMKVPVHFIGAEESPAVKVEGQMLNYIINEVEVECLPADLPEAFTVDLSKLEKNGIIHASDLTLPKGVTLVTHLEDDATLVTAFTQAEETATDAPAATGSEPAA